MVTGVPFRVIIFVEILLIDMLAAINVGITDCQQFIDLESIIANKVAFTGITCIFENDYLMNTHHNAGTVPTYPRECGRAFNDWTSFDEESKQFYNDTILEKLNLELRDVNFTCNDRPCGNEYDVHERIMNNFGLPTEFLLKALGISSLFKRDNQVLFDPDIVWKIGAGLKWKY